MPFCLPISSHFHVLTSSPPSSLVASPSLSHPGCVLLVVLQIFVCSISSSFPFLKLSFVYIYIYQTSYIHVIPATSHIKLSSFSHLCAFLHSHKTLCLLFTFLPPSLRRYHSILGI
ncbi:hypothetical protein [Phaffia rhodozyma]|uniref:Uncharacterized protein n=1 Tax=Phaffia rhodozyma TaxID=264483 RepID=A0A0F7SHY4_PHARH|nr:hypothetical protein [Phaffia rhodozyma]